MKLYFTCSEELVRGREAEIEEAIKAVLPGALVQYDTGIGALFVRAVQKSDEDEAKKAVCDALFSLGIVATPLSEREVPQPITLGGKSKPRRTVRLSTFLLSLIAAILITALLTFFLTSVFSALKTSPLGNDESVSENNLGKIQLVDEIFSKYSTYDINGNLQADAMLRAYVAATGDRYAAYYNAEEFAALQREESGQSTGIGVHVTIDDESGALFITRVLPASPAENAGVRAGDQLIYVGAGEEKVSVADIGSAAAILRMRGEVGTTAEFAVLRGDAEIAFSVTRAEFTALTVTGRVRKTDQAVGIVEITEFGANTPTQFKTVMQTLINEGCERFIFDVRDNPGGELRSITAVLSYFLNENDTVVSTVTADGETTTYTAKPVTYSDIYAPCSIVKEEIGMYRAFPKVVLTNGNTASAAELFTAALTDYGLADQVGTTTYGKGVYQNIISLENWGYSGALRLTVGKFNPPIRENFDGVGLAPDASLTVALPEKTIFRALSEADDPQLQKAIETVSNK